MRCLLSFFKASSLLSIFMAGSAFSQQAAYPKFSLDVNSPLIPDQKPSNGFLNGGDAIDLAPDGATMDNGLGGLISPQSILNTKLRRVQVRPFASISSTYSDNVNLSNNNRESGFLHALNAGVTADILTNRFNVAGTISASYVINPNGDNQFFVGAGSPLGAGIGGTAEFIEDRLFLDGYVDYTTAIGGNVGLNSPSGSSNGDVEGFGTINISPYYREKIGNVAVTELRYGYDQTFSDTGELGELSTHAYQATVGTGSRFNRLSVQGTAAHIRSDFDGGNLGSPGESGDMRQTSYELTSSYGVSRTLSLIGAVGYDEVEGSSIQDDTFSGTTYRGGFEYRPNSRMRLYAEAGERYNHVNYTVAGNYQVTDRAYLGAVAQTSLLPPQGSVSQRRNLAGNQGQTLQQAIDGGASVADAIRTTTGLTRGNVTEQGNGNFTVIGQDANLDPYISKTYALFGGYNAKRFNASATLGFEERNFERDIDEDAIVGNGQMNYQLTKKLSANLGGYYFALLSDSIAQESQTFGGRAGLNYALNRYLNAFTAVGYNKRRAPIDNNQFVENFATIGLSASF